MAFRVEDFRDLLRLLGDHPEWKEELRRAVLADDLLELPRIVRELADAQRRSEERLGELAVRMDQLTERVNQLAVRMDQLTARVDQLTERMDQLTARVDQLTVRMDQLAEAQLRTEETVRLLVVDVAELKRSVQRLTVDVARLNGSELERRFRENAPAYLGGRYRRGRVLSKRELMNALEDALDEGHLEESDAGLVGEAIRDVDAVVRARDADGDLWLVVEVSRVVDRRDVERARGRAEALARLGVRTVPAVAGRRVTEGAKEVQESLGVVWLQVPDGDDDG